MSVRLIVVSGPNKGAAYFLKEGQNVIGRVEEADIMLEHTQVSKRHCIINLTGRNAELIDAGSSNGTFINGILVKKKRLGANERISVGPFVLEIIVGSDASAGPGPGMAAGIGQGASSGQDADLLEQQLSSSKASGQKNIFTKLFHKFDEVVTPVVIDFNRRHEWWNLFATLFVIYVLLNIGLSVYPFLQTAEESVIREAEKRAEYIARMIADLNQEALADNQEGKMNIDFAEKDPAVREALIVDMNGRVLAPGSKVNENTSNAVIVKHLRKIRRGRKKDWILKRRRDSERQRVLITVPIFVRDPKNGLQVPRALVAVKFDLKGIALDIGTIGVVYFESLITALLLGSVFVFLMVRLTYHSINMLNDDMDNVLKGNETSVPKRYKMAPLEKLIDAINSALTRIPDLQSDEVESVDTTESEQQIVDSLMAPIQYLVTSSPAPMMLLDMFGNVITMSPLFEEMSGIHATGSEGSPIVEVARDDAFATMMTEMIASAPENGVEGVTEEFEFGSGAVKVHCLAVNSLPEKVEAFMVVLELEEGEDDYA